MNGYLDESNFMMVEEGFTTRDLLENLLMELCQAVRAGGSAAPQQPALPLQRLSWGGDCCSLWLSPRVTSKLSSWQTLGTL